MTPSIPSLPSPRRRHLAWLAVGLAATVMPAGRAAAQEFQLIVLEIEFADGSRRQGRDELILGNNNAVTINAKECAEDALITVDVRDYPTANSRLDVWKDQTADCNSTANRDPSQMLICDFLFNIENAGNQAQFNFTVPIASGAQPGMFDCENDNDGVYTIYGLATNGTMIAGESNGFATFLMELDTLPPTPPTDIQDRTANASVNVSWNVDSVANLFDFRVYVDEEATSCDDPTSPLVAGEPVPDSLRVQATVEAPSTSTSVNLSELGIQLGDSRPYVVTSRDLARNESVASAVGCLTRVQTSGFCDLHEADGGQCENCSLGGPASKGSGLLFGLLIVGLAWSSRRGARR